MKLIMNRFGYFVHCDSALTLPTHKCHKNWGSMMLLESGLRLTAEILVEWVIFADITLEFCMDLVTSYATWVWHSLLSVLGTVHTWWSFPPFFAFIDSCYGPMGGAVRWPIVWGVTAPWEIMLCSWVFWFAEPQCHVMDLTVCHSGCQIPHSIISSFVVAPCGFCSKAYSKGL
jgi:hypothetical protein